MSVPAAGHRISRKDGSRGDFLYSSERLCTLALLELFGLMTVRRRDPDEGQNWCVTEVQHTPFGDELLQLVLGAIERDLFSGKRPSTEFGAWQRLLQPFFPQWVNNLEIAKPESRDGVFYFKVSLGKPWRRIAVPATFDLEDLAGYIINAFDFGGDHLYGFRFAGRDGRQVRVEHPYINDAELHTDELAVGELPLAERQSMEFLYDFGAEWRFDVKLEKIVPDEGKLKEAAIVESRGEAPPEYEYDEDW